MVLRFLPITISGVQVDSIRAARLSNNDLRNPQDYCNTFAGPGDIYDDPAFVDNTAGDYHLSSLSR